MNAHERMERDHGERAISRFQRRIIEGITEAHTEQREIDPGTARLIAHVLGRAVGRDSHLAIYGRTGAGDYEQWRTEYLDLYEDSQTPPMIREWIDWLGTFLTSAHTDQDARSVAHERAQPGPPALSRGDLVVRGETLQVHVPGSTTGPELQVIARRLETLPELADDAFVAFLSLPDVDASDPDIVAAFHDSHVGTYTTLREALRVLTPLDDWEAEIEQWARSQGLELDAVSLKLDSVEATVRTVYDIVDRNDRIHAFTK